MESSLDDGFEAAGAGPLEIIRELLALNVIDCQHGSRAPPSDLRSMCTIGEPLLMHSRTSSPWPHGEAAFLLQPRR